VVFVMKNGIVYKNVAKGRAGSSGLNVEDSSARLEPGSANEGTSGSADERLRRDGWHPVFQD
jgi:hypothetical protein